MTIETRPNVLMVAQAFYPCAAVGAHRPSKLARHLSEDGWQVSVLTVREKYYPLLHPDVDEALRAEIPADVRVLRSAYLCPQALRPLARALQGRRSAAGAGAPAKGGVRNGAGLASWADTPTAIGWLPPGLLAGMQAARQADVIWATSPPTGGLCLAAVLSVLAHRPLVLDLRDPWGEGPHPTRLHRAWDRWWRHFVFSNSTRIVVVTDRMADDMRTQFPEHAHKITVIHNGYDADDFPTNGPAVPRETDLRLGYFGVLYQGRDRYMRELLMAMKALRQQAPCRLLVRGPTPRAVQDLVREAGIPDMVDVGGSVGYREALRQMTTMDVLVIIGSDQHGYALPGKLFEYIGARRPILAVTPPGELGHFVRTWKVGVAVDPVSGESIADALCELHRSYDEYRSRVETASRQFTRRRTAQLTAGVLRELCPQPPPSG